LIVVFGPLIAERVRLPGLMGLLLGGALIGPNMFNVLPSFESLDSVGSLGVLHIIFLAGLQLDIDSCMRYRKISAGFGLLTAFILLALDVGVWGKVSGRPLVPIHSSPPSGQRRTHLLRMVLQTPGPSSE